MAWSGSSFHHFCSYSIGQTKSHSPTHLQRSLGNVVQLIVPPKGSKANHGFVSQKHRPLPGISLTENSLVLPRLYSDIVQDPDPVVTSLLCFRPLTPSQGIPFDISAWLQVRALSRPIPCGLLVADLPLMSYPIPKKRPYFQLNWHPIQGLTIKRFTIGKSFIFDVI